MQSKTTINKIKLSKLWTLTAITFLTLFTGLAGAQTYTNGPLSTGATSSTGAAAPTGYTWSEVQAGNTNAGFGANITAGFTVADDFTVPAGGWNLTTARFYAYSTGFAGTTSPFVDVRIQIFNTDPSVGSPTPIFGNLTTNRFVSSADANMYRIFNGAPGTTRRIWEIVANINTSLTPGTYWIEWQLGNGGISNFSPPATIVGQVTQAGWNGKQHDINAATWVNLLDGANAQDMPFKLDYNTGSCSGTPAPGNTIASATTICQNIPLNLSLQNATSGAGVTYQWQSSADGTTWTNITGATNATYTTTLTATTYFQCVVTCSGNNGTSTPVLINMVPCYCDAGASGSFERIGNVKLGTIDNSSTGGSGYQDFTAVSTDVIAGATMPFTVTSTNGFGGDRIKIWIDFNQDFDFTDPGEQVYLAPTNSAGPYNGTIIIPSGATLGATRMRIRLYDNTDSDNNGSCGTDNWGEVEDYTVNVTPCVPISVTTQPTSQSASCGQNATFSIALTGSAPSASWEYRTSASGIWQNVPNAAPYSGVNTNTLTITAVTSALEGYQYRAVFQGACTALDHSSIGTLTVTPLIADVNPPSATICAGTIQQLSLTNLTSTLQSSTFASGSVNLAIPSADDGSLFDSNVIPVSGIPAGSIITDFKVTLNVAHPWIGDACFVLKGPNGQVLNLDYFLTGTGGVDISTGFTNTVFSPLGTTVLNAGTNPWTGLFKADAMTATVPTGFPPSGPVGYTPTTSTWNNLYSTLNGDWTLAFYDYFDASDDGTLNNWSITISYTSPTFAEGTWTGPAGTIFTDAAATIPYTGTPATTVYVLPTEGGVNNYDVSFSTAICQSSVTTVPVTVNIPLSGTSTVDDQSACEGTGTTFSSSTPENGQPVNHQWYMSTDGGATFTEVHNGGIYSGATTASLSISSVSMGMDGYVYYDSLYIPVCNSTLHSGNGTLTVHANPTPSLSANPSALFPGISTTINVNGASGSYTWNYNGSTIGNTSSSLPVNVDELGTYNVTVVDENGCEGSSSSITIRDSVTSTLFIYPNPTNNGQFNVRYYSNSNQGGRTINVFDSKGSRVYSNTFSIFGAYTNMPVNLSNLSKGVYTVELAERSGKRIKTGRILVL